MSNSGRIGGKKHSTTKKIVAPKAQIDGVGEGINREHRRAYAAMARKNQDILKEAGGLAAQYYDGDVEAAKAWLYEAREGESPLESIITGDGHKIIACLKEMLTAKEIRQSSAL
jgi:hypothetical protein